MTESITPPIIVADGVDCAFYREVADAVRSGIPTNALVFDAVGSRLAVDGGRLQVGLDADGAAELAGLLREWLGYVDAIRESTANWTLALLVRASVDHVGYR